MRTHLAPSVRRLTAATLFGAILAVGSVAGAGTPGTLGSGPVGGDVAKPAPIAQADLTAALKAGTASIVTENGVQLVRIPVTVTIRNTGSAPARASRVDAHHRKPGETTFYLTALSYVSGNGAASPNGGVDIPAIPTGGSVTFTGRVQIPRIFLTGTTRTELSVAADSCAGQEFVPSYCSVWESNETNNFSPAVSVALP